MTAFAVLLPPNKIAVAFRFLPVTVTVDPTVPLAVAVTRTGAWKTSLDVVTVPPAFVALMVDPDTAPAGIVTVIEFAFTTVNDAFTVPTLTAVAEPRFAPVRVKVEPISFVTEAAKTIAGLLVFDVLELNRVAEVAVPPVVVTRK
jgi:hypothetical protein